MTIIRKNNHKPTIKHNTNSHPETTIKTINNITNSKSNYNN